MGTQGWAIAGFVLMILVVIANYLRETARAHAARARAAAAPVPKIAPPAPQCAVLDCTEEPTKARHGWELCTGHYDEYVEAPVPRMPA